MPRDKLKFELQLAEAVLGAPSLRAVCGARFNKDFSALDALALTRASIQWPTLMRVMIAAASMK